MKSFKTTPKLNTNYLKYKESDIFIQKGLNKPEIEYKHKKVIPKNTFKSSYNILEWNDSSPYINPLIKIRENQNNLSQILNSNTTNYMKYNLNKVAGAQKKHKSFYEKMFESDSRKSINKSEIYSNARYQKETMNLGDYEGKEFKIKKNKSVIYDPSPYIQEKNPLKQKMDLIYGGCNDLIGDFKPAINRNKNLVRSVSSIGITKRDFETKNECDSRIKNNPKKMKYFSIYGNKGIENANKKLNPMTLKSSTNNKYIPGEEPTQNRINFLKSNIFNDKSIEKKNNHIKDKENNYKEYYNNENDKTIKVNRKQNKGVTRTISASLLPVKSKYDYNDDGDNVVKENHSKKFLYKQNEEKLPSKLDWKDSQFYLLFPQNKNTEIMKKNARQRKFKEIYGTDPIIPKEKMCEEFKTDERPEIDEAIKNNYQHKNINYSKIKRISDNISQIKGNIFINENKNNKNNKNFENDELKNNSNKRLIFEVKSSKNKKLITNYELEKHFANKGIHIYDIRENSGSLINHKNDNILEFKIRENDKDKNLEEKINKIKKEFKDKGYVINEKIDKKKENTDIIPNTLNWTNPHLNLMTKNKIAVKTNQGITHSKAPINKKNEEEKTTKITVNLKYKVRPYPQI